MKRWLLFFFGFAIIGIVLFTLMQSDSGYVLVSIHGKTIETSFWFAVLCVLCFSVSLYVVWRSIRGILLGTVNVAKAGSRWLNNRKVHTIEQSFRVGLLHLLTGNWLEASRQLSAVSKDTVLPLVRIIALAHSYHKQGEPEHALKLLEDAEQNYPKESVWILKARLSILIDTNAHNVSEHVLARLKSLVPNDKIVSQLEMNMRLGKHQWQHARALLPALRKTHMLSDGEHHDISVTTYVNALKDQNLKTTEDVDTVWKTIPKKLQKEYKLIKAYIEVLMSIGDDHKCEHIIISSLDRNWQPELLDLYAKIKGKDNNKQINRAQAWQKKVGDQFELNLALGILSARDQLWGQAKHYLERAVQERETAKACYFLGFVLEKMEDNQGSYTYYKKGAGAQLQKEG